ncbi:30S ribosomal protein S16-1, chloroplastic [Hypsizygus marmoreus]|uniref:30S ribosomal protein S16-1, chloroplastic n=1 Tax=Hypsizygus marmoreus TaxID=39966 RepID=A0A369KBU6_HYPMA|nr:30S ribosomal protein S16-1, chloroplastic [Hypsizygus marmoreus]
MPIRLRFALHGTRHNRVFHLVAIEQAQRRDAKPTETLGIYNRYIAKGQPQKTIEWSVDRIRYWLSVGAIPSKSVVKLLEMGNILKPGSQYHPKATGPPSEPISTTPKAPAAAADKVASA